MIDIKELPEGWESIGLMNISRVRTGKRDANHATPNGIYRFYTCAYEPLFCDTKSFHGECLILPGNGANVGEVFYYSGDFEAYQRTYVIDGISIFAKFLYYHFRWNWKGLTEKKQYGSATNYIRIGNFEDYHVRVPPLPTQHLIVAKIEALFSQLDHGIAQLKTAQAQLKVYRQAVLKWAFEGRLTNKDVKEGELPEGWKIAKLGQVITDIEAGKSMKCDERPPRENEVGIVKVSAVTWGIYDEEESKTCFSNSAYNPKYLIRKGDFLFSRANTIELVGACVIAHRTSKKLMLSDKILRFQFTAEVTKEFILHYLRSPKGRPEIEQKSSGNQMSMRNIGQGKIREIEIPLPPLPEQHRIVQEIESRLSVCDKIEETIIEGLQQAEALRQSILKRAFEGKLVGEVIL